jgi:hypothetical protein
MTEIASNIAAGLAKSTYQTSAQSSVKYYPGTNRLIGSTSSGEFR